MTRISKFDRALIAKNHELELLWASIGKYRKALDGIYNSGDAGRELVVKHYGTRHYPVTLTPSNSAKETT